MGGGERPVLRPCPRTRNGAKEARFPRAQRGRAVLWASGGDAARPRPRRRGIQGTSRQRRRGAAIGPAHRNLGPCPTHRPPRRVGAVAPAHARDAGEPRARGAPRAQAAELGPRGRARGAVFVAAKSFFGLQSFLSAKFFVCLQSLGEPQKLSVRGRLSRFALWRRPMPDARLRCQTGRTTFRPSWTAATASSRTGNG